MRGGVHGALHVAGLIKKLAELEVTSYRNFIQDRFTNFGKDGT
jgi:hypothetical protein